MTEFQQNILKRKFDFFLKPPEKEKKLLQTSFESIYFYFNFLFIQPLLIGTACIYLNLTTLKTIISNIGGNSASVNAIGILVLSMLLAGQGLKLTLTTMLATIKNQPVKPAILQGTTSIVILLLSYAAIYYGWIKFYLYAKDFV